MLYIDISKNELTRSAIKFGFVESYDSRKLKYKLDTLAQSPDLNIEITQLKIGDRFLKKRVPTRSKTSKSCMNHAFQLRVEQNTSGL